MRYTLKISEKWISQWVNEIYFSYVFTLAVFCQSLELRHKTRRLLLHYSGGLSERSWGWVVSHASFNIRAHAGFKSTSMKSTVKGPSPSLAGTQYPLPLGANLKRARTGCEHRWSTGFGVTLDPGQNCSLVGSLFLTGLGLLSAPKGCRSSSLFSDSSWIL